MAEDIKRIIPDKKDFERGPEATAKAMRDQAMENFFKVVANVLATNPAPFGITPAPGSETTNTKK